MHVRILFPLLFISSLAAAQSGTRERGRFSLQGDPATWMAIDPPVKHVLIAFNAGGVCVFPGDQKVVNVYAHPIHKKTVTGAAFLPDGKTFVTVSLDGTMKTWETAAALEYLREMEDKNGDAKPAVPKPVHTVTAHSGYGVTCVAVSPDGKRFATGATDGTVKLWDAEAVKQTASLAAAHLGAVKAVQFSPDGKTLASGGVDKAAQLWDVGGDKPVLRQKLEGHDGPVYAVAFSPDGGLLAAGTGVAEEERRRPGVGHGHWQAGLQAGRARGRGDVVVFHPKTAHLARGGADKMIRVWDLKEKVTQYTDEHSEPLGSLVISADGARFGSCSAMAVRWWAGFGKCRIVAKRRTGRGPSPGPVVFGLERTHSGIASLHQPAARARANRSSLLALRAGTEARHPRATCREPTGGTEPGQSEAPAGRPGPGRRPPGPGRPAGPRRPAAGTYSAPRTGCGDGGVMGRGRIPAGRPGQRGRVGVGGRRG